MARPWSCWAVYGLRSGAGFDQLLSIIGGTTVVSRPPMKNNTSAATIAKLKLLSALPSILAPPDYRRHDVVRERDNAAEDQHPREEADQPDRFERDHRVDEGDRRVVPLPALPEAAEPESDEKAEAADHHQPEAPVGEGVAVE